MDPDLQFDALFEQYVFNIANEVVGDATPVQQKALIDLLLSVDAPASVDDPALQASPVEEAVTGSKPSHRRFRRSSVRKRPTDHQYRRVILQLSIEQNQRQITYAIAYINLLDELIVQAENTLLNNDVKRSIVASYQRVITIYSVQLRRLKDFNYALSHSVSQLV